MILSIKYDINKDIYNYMAVNGAKYKGGSSQVLNYYFKKFSELTEENLKKFIKGYVSYNSIDINKKLTSVQESWAKIEDKFIVRMDSLFNTNFPLENFTAYLTTADRCTLARDFFFVAVLSQDTNKIIMHELLHFYTYIAFEKEFSELNEKQIYDIKETMTELLNSEFLDLMKVPENGYPQHKELRERFKELWQKEKDVKRTGVLLIDMVKNEGSAIMN